MRDKKQSVKQPVKQLVKQPIKQQRLLFVDFENVQNVDLTKVDSSIRIVIFVGKNQKTLSLDLVMKSQSLGSRLEWKQVDGHGKNALDFFIVYYVGKTLEKNPNTECIILSKDKGFDPLLKYLRLKDRKCSRIDALTELK